ncbi:hypothetical protein CHS0354_035319 [Potamilus streckersoni]|uniref:Ribonuclease G n=1 Tax=Potamilus streckersoni TaxID=2493646 RepID=A0AAE0S2Z4_9BIVA|nr:hypothetical protein CHS0354_035319 [Potamilus streckersoni]
MTVVSASKYPVWKMGEKRRMENMTINTMRNNKEMIFNASKDESRVAIVKNRMITELSVEQISGSLLKGNIYKARIVQIQDALQAAFVDYGEKRQGFLALDEVNYEQPPTAVPSVPRLRVGQHLMVQVIREATETKGAALTTFITLPGMYLIFSPKGGEGGVSKKIQDDDERERLKSFISGIASEKNSVIIRTAEWESIKEKYERMQSVGLLAEEADNAVKMIRDYYTDEVAHVWVDNPETFHKIHAYFRVFLPAHIGKLKLIEKQIEQLSDSKVPLASGGSIVIQQTEALVSIDVNSGRSNQEAFGQRTALRTNLEAADEIARQLRLRNLAGLIVIDFIDMKDPDDCRQVESVLESAMEEDKASHTIGTISQFGLLELSRQRISQGYATTLEDKCLHCKGTGRIPNKITYANSFMRKLRNIASQKDSDAISVTLPTSSAVYILNEKRTDIYDIEMEFGVSIRIAASNDLGVTEDVVIRTTAKQAFTKDTEEESRPAKEDNKIGSEQKTGGTMSADVKWAGEAIKTVNSEAKMNALLTLLTAVTSPMKMILPAEQLNADIVRQHITGNADNPPAAEFVSDSCTFKDIKLPDPTAAGFMDEFYGRLRGRYMGGREIFIDRKYLHQTSNESAFFTPETAAIIGLRHSTAEGLPYILTKNSMEQSVNTDGMSADSAIEASELDFAADKSSEYAKISSDKVETKPAQKSTKSKNSSNNKTKPAPVEKSAKAKTGVNKVSEAEGQKKAGSVDTVRSAKAGAKTASKTKTAATVKEAEDKTDKNTETKKTTNIRTRRNRYINTCKAVPACRFFLMGNSMGAMICLFLSLRMPDIKGLILIAPYIDLPPFKKVLYKTLTNLAYSLFGASFSTQAIFSYDNLTTDHAQRAYYQQDPYRSKNITAGFSRAMFKQLPADKHLPDLPAVPVLMVNSGSDRIVDVCAAQRLFHRFPHPIKR